LFKSPSNGSALITKIATHKTIEHLGINIAEIDENGKSHWNSILFFHHFA
jgi:hypothetical protein